MMIIKRTYVPRPKRSVYAYSRRRNICEIYQRAHEEVVQVATLWSDRRRPIIDNRGKAYILSIPFFRRAALEAIRVAISCRLVAY